ncbi:hypothetical protein P4123_01360 [Pseudomonas aeruginosa]|nr:hypothetical protein [Pseudomonas aeruginosa]
MPDYTLVDARIGYDLGKLGLKAWTSASMPTTCWTRTTWRPATAWTSATSARSATSPRR